MIMKSLTSEWESTLLEKEERYKASKSRFPILVVADDSVSREVLVMLMNQEPDSLVCSEAESADQALEIMDKQQVDCAVVSLSVNHADYSFAEKVALQHPSLILLTVTSDELRYSKNASRRTIGGHIISQEETKKIMSAIHYAHTLLRSGIRGFAIFSKLTWSMTHYLGFHKL